MRNSIIAVVAGAAIIATCSPGAQGAEVYTRTHHGGAADPACRYAWRCGPTGCGWKRICFRFCPAGSSMSCYPLYGAYGPSGGASYWGAFTGAGWGY
jgi:hypothetical protein